jgi:hypothetical protein
MTSTRFTTFASPLSNSRTIVQRMAAPRLEVEEAIRLYVAASQRFAAFQARSPHSLARNRKLLELRIDA